MEIQVNERENFAAYSEIANLLQTYLDAAKTGVPQNLREIWFDHARIVGSVEGAFVANDPDTFVAWVKENESSPEIQSKIVSIDVSGNAAAARIEFVDWLGFRFTDFFVLYKQDNLWRISGKVFDAHARR